MSEMPRIGNWIETYTGMHFWPLDPWPDEIVPEDIAHALSQICRFTGHTRWFYSVAQHSLLCAEYARRLGHSPELQLRALLHDASEAYICDVARPVKPWLTGYDKIEEFIMLAVHLRFGLKHEDPEADEKVKQIDNAMLHMEARRLMPKAEWATEPGDAEMAKLIGYEPMHHVEQKFLLRLGALRIETGNLFYFDT